jgi:hypothetical protein
VPQVTPWEKNPFTVFMSTFRRVIPMAKARLMFEGTALRHTLLWNIHLE